MKKFILLFTLFFSIKCLCQKTSTSYQDSVAAHIDDDTTLTMKLAVDTLYTYKGDKYELSGTVKIYTHPIKRQVQKVKLDSDGKYFSHITFYYQDGSPFKANIHVRQKESDIAPEFEDEVVAYFSGDKITESKSKANGCYQINVMAYLYTMQHFLNAR